MNCFSELPEGFGEAFSVDLQKDKKLAIRINIAALGFGIILGIIGHIFQPIASLFDMSGGLLAYALRFLTLIGLLVIYIILHELTHGVVMKIYGAPKIKYGFTGVYAFAGSDCYFAKTPYIVIALAPVILWGIVLALICPFLSGGWFWVAYIVQIQNLSGAAGDIYVTCKFLKLSKDILIKDDGVSMTIYNKI